MKFSNIIKKNEESLFDQEKVIYEMTDSCKQHEICIFNIKFEDIDSDDGLFNNDFY
jgi:hypothetical protein